MNPSTHKAKVYAAVLSRPNEWLTHEQIVRIATGVALRTVREHAKSLADAGLLERKWAFPSTYYRVVADVPEHARELRDALMLAASLASNKV